MKPKPQRLRPYRGDNYCDAGGISSSSRAIEASSGSGRDARMMRQRKILGGRC